MDQDFGTRTRWPWLAPAVAIVLVLTMLGSLQPFGPTVVRAAGGLVLGLVVVAVAAWINRRDRRRRFVADGTLCGVDLSIYYFVANPLLETVIIPLALLTNWHIPRRRALLIVTALVFYGMRVWTYLYFAPIFVDLALLPSGQPFSPAVLEQISQFTNLSWVRLSIEALTCAGLLLALRVSIPPADPASIPNRRVNPTAVAA